MAIGSRGTRGEFKMQKKGPPTPNVRVGQGGCGTAARLEKQTKTHE